uniref:LRX6 n=1 Tax=Catalpa bungei TaxID=265496 RepID=A0A142CD33_9LAMI|nr:LRX6 [Catalpa bungei]
MVTEQPNRSVTMTIQCHPASQTIALLFPLSSMNPFPLKIARATYGTLKQKMRVTTQVHGTNTSNHLSKELINKPLKNCTVLNQALVTWQKREDFMQSKPSILAEQLPEEQFTLH